MVRRKRKIAAPYEALKVRHESKRRFERIAAQNRLPLADAAEVALDAWERLDPREQMEIIRRPDAGLAAAS